MSIVGDVRLPSIALFEEQTKCHLCDTPQSSQKARKQKFFFRQVLAMGLLYRIVCALAPVAVQRVVWWVSLGAQKTLARKVVHH